VLVETAIPFDHAVETAFAQHVVAFRELMQQPWINPTWLLIPSVENSGSK
jgi:hypothetical protein